MFGDRLGDRLSNRVGLALGRRRRSRLPAEHRGGGGVAAADPPAEDRVAEPVLLDAAAPLERLGCHRRPEVIAAARVILDLGVRPGDRALDALLYVLRG